MGVKSGSDSTQQVVGTDGGAGQKSRFVLAEWSPEDPAKWNSRLAWTTLTISTYSMVLAFCVWFLPSAIAPTLKDIGFNLTANQLFLLTSMPGLACGFLRFIYTFLPPVIGTRKLVGISSLLYVIPMLGWFFAVQDNTTPYWWLLALAFMCGIGGGSFSGYMPSTGYFFPKRLSGTALGLQAGIGNLGMSIIQLVGPILMGFSLFGITFIKPQVKANGADIWVHNAAVFFVPWCILAAVLAFVLLRDVPIKANIKEQLDIFSNKNTWFMTVLYVMTFGIFSGYAAVFGLVINNSYGSLGFKGASFAFLAPLIGSVVRMAWGPFCDKFGGAIWTFISGAGMAVLLAVSAIILLQQPSNTSFWLFLAAMLAMFFFSGLGNAGTFKQMPMIMPKRQAGGAIGFTAAIASFGPFLVSISLTVVSPAAFFIGSAVFCVIGAVLCWVMYARPNAPFPG